jgi:hypothetical protein
MQNQRERHRDTERKKEEKEKKRIALNRYLSFHSLCLHASVANSLEERKAESR